MSQVETPSAAGCVPVSHTCKQCPPGEICPQWEDATAENGPAVYDAGPPPTTVSPFEHVIAEPVLIAMLQRQFGWIVTAPGKMQRYRR